jgi:hypothetical protein
MKTRLLKYPALLLFVLLLATGACSDDDDSSPPIQTPDVTEDTSEPTPLPGRQPRRMSIEQLQRSIPIVTGGLEWVEDFGEGELNMLTILAPTLGAPDYLLVTEENLEPSLIIAKFIQDASHRICTKWVERDKARPASERTLVIHDDWYSVDEETVKTNIRALLFRFFAKAVDAQDDLAVQDLYELFGAAALNAPLANKADDGWLAVCLALMSDPEFILY